MKDRVQAAVIGGGVVGASVLYHLTKAGWRDVVLIERSELTSGSTWHAAGGMHTLNSDPNVAKLQSYTIALYRELEEISGQSCGIHLTGGIMLAGTPERLDYLKVAQSKNRLLGLETEFISLDEAEAIFPIMDKRHFLGALYDANEGHVDPSGVTNAYAKAARLQGAEIYRHTPVVELSPTPEGGWLVVTDKGTIHAEQVVNAGGLWARELGRMVGLELPLLAMEHQYIVTDDMPEVAAHGRELAHCIDFEGEAYMRQEGRGMVLGTYERAGVPWARARTPMDFGHELLQPDLDRIAPSLEVAFEHFPALGNAGIKRTINGPFVFAPDGNPVIGPVRGLPGYWLATGVMAGFSQGGGVGLTLANWMVEGDPGMDVFAMDNARFGAWADRAYTHAKVQENYSRRFSITFPNEELPAAREQRTTPVYKELSAAGAVWGATYGLEQALWFSPEGQEQRETPSFRRSNAFDPVAAEVQACREGVGLFETSGFAKYQVTGKDSEAWLDSLLAGRLPKAGRIALTPMLAPDGRLRGDFTVARADRETFNIFGSGPSEGFHLRWFESRMNGAEVTVEAQGDNLVGFMIAGPKSRELLSRLAEGDVSANAFPFLSFARLHVAGVPTLVGRISFTGDLGYELWVAPEDQPRLLAELRSHGEDLGLRLFGSRALDSMRLEKGYGGWLREYSVDDEPYEAGLGRFVALGKGDFVGRAAAERTKAEGPKRRLVTLLVKTDDADAWGDEAVWHDGQVVGNVTSGGYGHFVRQSIALAYVPAELAANGASKEASFEVEILGERRPARLTASPPFDPSGARMRS